MEKLSEFKKAKKGISQLIDFKGHSQNEISVICGVSSATITNIVSENTDKVSDTMLAKVNNELNRLLIKDWSVINTYNFTSIESACNEARTRKRMIGVVGFTGAGKTIGLKYYNASQRETYFVTCRKSMRAKQFFKSILKSLGVKFDGSLHDIIERIADKLSEKQNPLLIIDEAGKLSKNCLMYLHDLRELTINNTGIVLAGVDYFKMNLTRFVERQKEGMEEFYDRIGKWIRLSRPTHKEIKAICKANMITNSSDINTLLSVNNYRVLRDCIINMRIEKGVFN